MTKESLNDSLFELNKLILDLRSKLSKSLQEVLKLRKDLDLEKEEHQLTVLKYNKLKDAITLEIDNKLNKARECCRGDSKMKYLVNFIIDQKFSEIVEAEDKEEAIDKAKVYLKNRFVELKYNKITTTEIYDRT